jgi:hypothetical protein
MPFVHLANGDVKHHSQEELDDLFGQVGHSRAYRDNGVESQVIGIYPDDVEYERDDDEKGRDAEKAEFAEWKRNRNEPQDETQNEERDDV